MGHFFQPSFQFNLDPQPQNETNLNINVGPQSLSLFGFNIPVIITSVPLDKDSPNVKSKLVIAHFDTGASITSIDEKIADELELTPIGASTSLTAAGPKDVKQYIVQILFPNTQLKGYMLQVSDCNLSYITEDGINANNFGVLLGRDIMSYWNIIWNGPSSTVIISD